MPPAHQVCSCILLLPYRTLAPSRCTLRAASAWSCLASTHVPGGQPLVGFGGQHLGADNRPGSNVLPRLTLACVRWRNGLKIVGIVVGSLIETCLRSSRCAEPWDPTRDTPNRWYAGGAAAAVEERARDVRTPCAHRRRHQRRSQPQSRPAHLPRPREPFLRAAA